MKKGVRNILYLGLLVVLIIGFGSIAVLCRAGRDAKKCHSVIVNIAESYRFVTEEDVVNRLKKGYGDCIGMHLDSLKLHKIEEIIDGEGAVKKSQAYITEDGVLHIHVTQREPFVRLQGEDFGFYVDHDGYIFPLQQNYTSHVAVVDGHIPVNIPVGFKGMAPHKGEQEWINGIISMLDFMHGSIWDKNIVQIHVQEGGQLCLVPREGKEMFLFGKPVEVSEKFDRIEKYYGFIKPTVEEDHYTRVDVRYNGQIVCK